ncbi:MAG TPA: acetyl-CoA carboxylase biotin carboxylase subunit [Proteobacteria bacterium]|nr:biotin carboxylase [bacterium BMS3Abin14]HDL52546.1 acetyl-CoA carboxylase biotin carboxylase subunit [Pseudomonadota bacterium]
MPRLFSKILIANRGEIALRVIRACRELGVKTVAVFSDADRDALHTRFADESICIGPANSLQSYLNIPAIISAAEVSDAEAIHPGYGFLAENPEFAEVCEASGIKFIGPESAHIRTMGNKIMARALAVRAKLPILAGGVGGLDDPEDALESARNLGFPVIIKAAAGGGGRGIRVVHSEASFRASFSMAQSEAGASFNNPEVYVERFIESPRHIEFQILADTHGNIIHLGERDCSIQRRYQKLIEESPSPMLDEDLRERMGKAAIAVTKEAGYVNAGTVEFLVDKDMNFYFMEMNTRIQVEHPVTECVTGLDLVKEQIRISAGFHLAWEQKDVRFQGHAIECRINAEDPDDFRPNPGTIRFYYAPGGPGIRVDSAAYESYYIPPYYDSMIAKLIAHGRDREEALARMRRALEEFVIEGVKTTIPFHLRVLSETKFQRGEYGTDFLEKMLS